MHNQRFAAKARQRGVATLVVAIVLLIAATFLTFFAARIGIQDQRMAGNDARQKGSLAVAEALLSRAKTFLDISAVDDIDGWSWTTCANVTPPAPAPLPCGDGKSSDLVFDAGTWEYVDVATLPAAGGGTSGAEALAPPDPDPDPDTEPLKGRAFFLRRVGAAGLSQLEPLVLVAQGKSKDDTGETLVRQVMRRTFTVPPGPLPPLTAPMVGALGSFNLVGNPNHVWCDIDDDKCKRDQLEHILSITPQNCDSLVDSPPGGSGQMISIWTEATFNQLVSGVGSWDICHASYFKKNTDPLLGWYGDCFLGTTTQGCGCQTDDDPMASVCKSQKWAAGDAQKFEQCGVVESDPDFPEDVFAWVFGASPADVRARADQVVASCDGLNADSRGLIWVTGNCSPPGDVGSRFAPAVLVVEGELDFGANRHVWGLVVAHDSPSIKLGGGFTLHGAMVVDSDDTDFQASGTYNAIYDPCVFAGIYNNSAFVEYAPVEGSWSDRL